jgi:peptidoglycan/LPS O-acetylase OafA/YrhL
MTDKKTRPALVYTLMVLVAFQGISGILGGFGLISDPSGESLQIPLDWLEGSPFDNYLIPGIILFFILGIFPLIVLFGLWKNAVWSWYGALLLGVALIIWIGVEILIIGYHMQPPLQLIYGTLGIIILFVASMPPVKKYFQTIP